MADYQVIRRVSLGSQHPPTRNTTHLIGEEVAEPAASLQIVKHPGDRGYYLLYFDENGREFTDTYHDTLQGAMSQAEWEYRVRPEEWERVGTVGWGE